MLRICLHVLESTKEKWWKVATALLLLHSSSESKCMHSDAIIIAYKFGFMKKKTFRSRNYSHSFASYCNAIERISFSIKLKIMEQKSIENDKTPRFVVTNELFQIKGIICGQSARMAGKNGKQIKYFHLIYVWKSHSHFIPN